MLPLLETPTPAQEADVWKKVRSRVKRPEVAVYADWVGEVMKKEPKLFEGYERGVVRVRERFLDWTEKEGSKSWAEAKAGKYKLRGNKVGRVEPERDVEKLPKKWLLVPVAVPGCGESFASTYRYGASALSGAGKTLIGLALSHLFGFGHTQSDDVTAKRTAPTFLKNIAALLQKKDVVFADR
jgi:tRNA ligase